MLAFHPDGVKMESFHSMAERKVKNAIGSQVHKIRNHQKLTQSDLAARCHLAGFDIVRETVSQIERGTRGVSDLEMILIARALKVDLQNLVPVTLPVWTKDLRPPNAVE